MKKIALALFSVGLCIASATHAQYSADTSGQTDSSDDTATFLKNLGTYIGYNIVNPADSYTSLLLTSTATAVAQGQQILNIFFGARPVNYPYFSQFSTNSNYSAFNKQANVLFNDTYSTAGGDNSTTLTVVPGFDQKDYQSNPLNQAIFNMLVTPNTSLCEEDGDACMTQQQVMSTALQDVVDSKTKYLPSETQFFTKLFVNNFANQLNADTLISPLIYSETKEQQSISGALPASSQEQVAMNFIRYVTNAVLPIDSMSQEDYSKMWSSATTKIDSSMTNDQINTIKSSQKDLMTYLLKQRVYMAQVSLASSNFYRAMQARMAQKQASGNTTSQAFNEFVMATWRLYSPNPGTDGQWVDQISKASAATTQKEMAILLSEINYQLYLGRQTQERILLTNSLLALQSLANAQPTNTTTTVSVDTGSSGTTAPAS